MLDPNVSPAGPSTETFPPDETALALALLERDAQAATLAWQRYSPLVLGFLHRFFGHNRVHDHDRQDLCQEVFLRFFRRIDELREPTALRGFLISICLGVARNEHRRARVRRWMQLTSTGELPEIPVRAFDPEARETTGRLQDLLTRLSGEDRSLFLTRYVEDMQVADIAAFHGLSFGTTKRRLARATRRVTARMSRDPLLSALWSRREPPPRRRRGAPRGAVATRRSSILEA